MSLEKAYGVYRQFKQVQAQVANIQAMYDESMTTNFEVKPLTAENLGFEEAAYELLDFVKELVSKIEDTDTNLDPELTNLKGVANLFEGHPATDYVNSAINEVYNQSGEAKVYGENEIHDHLFEGLCWCRFKAKLRRMKLTVDTAPISAACLSGIEATRGIEGECFHCCKREATPCDTDITNCYCFDKYPYEDGTEPTTQGEIKSAILDVTDPVEPFIRPNPTCKLVCTRNHCSCKDGW